MADQAENFPDSIRGYSSLILLGGPISVYGNYNFLQREERLIKDALSRKIPILGICLGSQLLAKILGATVYKGKQKEIGWYKVRFSNISNDKIFYDFGNETIVFQWHGDTFDLPSNCIRLASSNLYPNQAFRFRNNVYALQFHLEVTKSIIKNWINEYKNELDQLKDTINASEIIKKTPANIKTTSKISEKFFSRFIKLVIKQ